MAALGWLMNLDFAGGSAFASDSRITTISSADRTMALATRDSICEIPSSNRTFTPADD